MRLLLLFILVFSVAAASSGIPFSLHRFSYHPNPSKMCTPSRDGALMRDVTTPDVYRCDGPTSTWRLRTARLRPPALPPRSDVVGSRDIIIIRVCSMDTLNAHPNTYATCVLDRLLTCLNTRKTYICSNINEDHTSQQVLHWKLRTNK